MATVERTRHRLGSRHGLTTLEQRYRFAGERGDAIARVLLTAALTGGDSIFGDRPGEEGARTKSTRTLRGFSPAPGFRFDVVLGHYDESTFLVRFSQPDRKVPYLQGHLVWAVADEGDDAILDEQINTERALQIAGEPLTGPRPSLRRWLFFRAGHKQVMSRATRNIGLLLDRP